MPAVAEPVAASERALLVELQRLAGEGDIAAVRERLPALRAIPAAAALEAELAALAEGYQMVRLRERIAAALAGDGPV